MNRNNAPDLLTEVDAQVFFQDAVQSALSHQQQSARHETVIYLANLLNLALYTEKMFDSDASRQGHTPLALLYGEALEAPSISHRDNALKKLGDIALFISGVFANSLNRSLVDIDYYINMGGNAYGFLADSRYVSRQSDAHKIVYHELAGQFTCFVDVLAEVCDTTNTESSIDIMRLYEVWQRTGSERTLKKLRDIGIEPVKTGLTRH